ncbi:MAG: 4-(cytidine 5'-diphospho)-2-C-methyl-D-erythritol kinase [Armatimonadetes bacterium]|nr:4-(cytidine 5'-diphospho)-2-C-methyl-D-erythritol kinase [Armatimonadota bacterium]
MIIDTCAKVNLTLEVLARRQDGFHELATVFQAVDLCDRLVFGESDQLELVVHGAPIPADERNLCYQAAQLLARHAGIEPRVRIEVFKRIPIGGGLGGGSGNAAGTLAALNLLWQVGLAENELEGLAAELGSDCAFFVRGGAAVGRGRGERLERLPAPTGWTILIVGPSQPVPTGLVYRALESFRPEAGAATAALEAGLRAGCVPPLGEWLCNDLEVPASKVSRALAAEREVLEEAAAGCYRLSGSGGSWFVLAEDADAAESLRTTLLQAWPGRLVAVTRPVDWGWRQVS